MVKITKALFDGFLPELEYSEDWEQWVTLFSSGTCIYCWDMFGKIFRIGEEPEQIPPVHENCGCEIIPLLSVLVGNATINGESGADYWLFQYGHLPDYYIGKEEAKSLGWESWRGNLGSVLPGRMIGGSIFWNRNEKLPSKVGRIWYEADINYQKGYRNLHRVVYSNDGLIFVTYDHYMTFVAVRSA
ncbi:MAG: phage head morphogenesis protein [Oscillospiraceae bacterium]|jgi:hypothetical protein|nr:phage head morphogenesis protein [Oscillospiraceae bacterium]